MNDKKLYTILSQDNPGLENESTKQRLEYAFMLQSAKHPVRRNGFQIKKSLFSLRNAGFKTAMLSAVIVMMLFIGKVPTGNPVLMHADSTLNSLVAQDSIYTNMMMEDSIRVN